MCLQHGAQCLFPNQFPIHGKWYLPVHSLLAQPLSVIFANSLLSSSDFEAPEDLVPSPAFVSPRITTFNPIHLYRDDIQNSSLAQPRLLSFASY